MPFNYAHALLALEAQEAAGPAAQAVIRACPAAYRAGAMGPDPYFADDMPRPLFRKSAAALAGRLHALDARTLFPAVLASADTPAARAYALGLVCHFALDANAHAYILARFPGKAHTPAEMHMDLPFCDRYAHPALAVRPPAFFHLSARALREIDALHASAAQTLFSAGSRGAFSRSYRKWIGLISRVTFDPHGRKLRFFARLERRPGDITGWLVTRDPADGPRDLMNLKHAPWTPPWAAEARTESFPDLFSSALSEAPALLDAAAESLSGGGTARLTGLIGPRCMDGRPLL